MKEHALRLYRQAAESVLVRLQTAQRYANAARDRAKLQQVSGDDTSALDAFNLCMDVLRAWDAAPDTSAQHGWALEARKVNAELKACRAPLLHHTRQQWFRKSDPVRTPKEHQELTARCQEEAHMRLEGWSARTGGTYVLTMVDPKRNEAKSCCSATLIGFPTAFDLPQAMMGWESTMKTYLLAKAAASRQQKAFVSLERPEQVAACKTLYKVVIGGDHRGRYPFNGVQPVAFHASRAVVHHADVSCWTLAMCCNQVTAPSCAQPWHLQIVLALQMPRPARHRCSETAFLGQRRFHIAPLLTSKMISLPVCLMHLWHISCSTFPGPLRQSTSVFT